MDYQVFLSFKNTDNGESTPDSKIGEDLYVYLTQRGIKVFFSNISLLEFGEAAYKDAIDDALDEVNIMLVIGSRSEYLTSKWCKYEWGSYQQNILSNIVQGNLVTYIGDMALSEVPTAIRHYQSFRIGNDSVEKVGDFIINAIKKCKKPAEQPTETKESNDNDSVEFKKKNSSLYSPLYRGELKRLTLQGNLTKKADTPSLHDAYAILKDNDRICVLDVGCGYGNVTRDRFSKWENAFVVGIDISDEVLEKARSFNNNPQKFVFERVNIDSDEFEEELEDIMIKHQIEKFDFVFGAYILQHIKDPVRFLRRIRPFISKNGYVLFRNTADKSTVSYGDDGLIKKIQDKTEEGPGNAARDTGIELYHYLYTTGYKNIKVYGFLKDISNMDYDERMEIFKERFGWRNMYFKMAFEKDPTDLKMKSSYEWMQYALEKLEELFGSQSFWYGETIINVLAKKS